MFVTKIYISWGWAAEKSHGIDRLTLLDFGRVWFIDNKKNLRTRMSLRRAQSPDGATLNLTRSVSACLFESAAKCTLS